MPIKNTQRLIKNYPTVGLYLVLFDMLLCTHATPFEPLTYSRVILLSLDYRAHEEKKGCPQQQLKKHSNGIWVDQVTR